MKDNVWIFPILFILHDMEEIIGLDAWLKKNRALLINRYPTISRAYRSYSTEGMAAAVLEELLLCIIICAAAELGGFYRLWLGVFAAFALHLVVHIVQTAVFRGYIPAVITSLLCLPPSVWLISCWIGAISCSAAQLLLYTAAGAAITAGNLKIAHMIIRAFTKRCSL